MFVSILEFIEDVLELGYPIFQQFLLRLGILSILLFFVKQFFDLDFEAVLNFPDPGLVSHLAFEKELFIHLDLGIQ